MSDLVEHSKAYHGYLVEFMRFHAPDAGYDETTVFSVEVLSEIKPNDITRWMQLKAFGEPDPSPDALPLKGRANSLGQYKKRFPTTCEL